MGESLQLQRFSPRGERSKPHIGPSSPGVLHQEAPRTFVFFQRKHTDGQQTHEKTLDFTDHQRNANQNHSEISPHTCQNGCHQKDSKYKCWRGCGEKGTLLHCWWECKLMQPLWKTVRRFLKKLKVELHVIQQFHSWVYSKGNGNTNSKRYMHPNVLAALLTIAKIWKQPKCPSTDEWIKKMWCVYTQWNSTQP